MKPEVAKKKLEKEQTSSCQYMLLRLSRVLWSQDSMTLK